MPDLGKARQTTPTANPRSEYRSGQYLIRLNVGTAAPSPRSRKARAAAEAARAAERGRSLGSNVAEQQDAISRAFDAKPIVQSGNPDGELDEISRALRNLGSTGPMANAETPSRHAVPVAPPNGLEQLGKNARPVATTEALPNPEQAGRGIVPVPKDSAIPGRARTKQRSVTLGSILGWNRAKEHLVTLGSDAWTGARTRAIALAAIVWSGLKAYLGGLNWMRKVPRASIALLVGLGVMDAILAIQLSQTESFGNAPIAKRAPSPAATVEPRVDDTTASASVPPAAKFGGRPESASRDDRSTASALKRSSLDAPASIAPAKPRAEHKPDDASNIAVSAPKTGGSAPNHGKNAAPPASASAPLMIGRAESEDGLPPRLPISPAQPGANDLPTAPPLAVLGKGGRGPNPIASTSNVTPSAEIERPRKPSNPPADQSAASASADRRPGPVPSARSDAARFFVQFAAYRLEPNAAAECGKFAGLAVTEITKAISGGTTWFLCRTAAPLTHRDAAALVETVKSKMNVTAVLTKDAPH